MITNNQYVLQILQREVIDTERKELTILSTGLLLEQDFISAKITNKGSLYTANLKMIEIDLVGKWELTSEWVRYNRFVSCYDIDGGQEQEIKYGDFGIVKSEYNDTTKITTLTGYDKMILTNVPYSNEEVGLTYPKTIQEIVEGIATACNLELAVNTYPNSNVSVLVDLWANQSFTYRDVLNHIAQATASTMAIKDGKLTIYQPQETNFPLVGKFTSLATGDNYGEINILNITQEPQHYNKFTPPNALEIPIDDRRELVFENNPILLTDMEGWGTNLFPKLNNLEYTTIKSNAVGYGIFDVGDIVDVHEFNTNTDYKVLITNETFTNKQSVVTEINSDNPFTYQNQYVVETDQQRQGQETYFLVDQLNGIIKALVEKVDDTSEQLAQLTIRVDQIETEVTSNAMGTNLIPNLNALLDIEDGKYPFWKSSQGGLQTIFQTLQQTYVSNSPTFIVVDDANSISSKSKQYYTNGTMYSALAFIVPTNVYSYRCKRTQGNTPMDLVVVEYNDQKEEIVRTVHNLSGQVQIETVTFTPAQMTMYVGLEMVTHDDSQFNIAEEMFVRGNPVQWSEDANDVKIYAQSLVTQLDNSLSIRITEISDDIHNAGVEITAREGIKVYGKNFIIQNEDRTKDIFRVVTIDGEEQVYMYGSIQSEGGEIAFDSENKAIKIGSVRLRNWNTNNDSLGMYGNQFTFMLGQNGGLSINKNIGGTDSDWVIFKNFDNNTTTGYFDDLRTTSLRTNTISANVLTDFVSMSRLTVTSNLNSNSFTATGIYPSTFAGSKWIGNGSARWEYIYLQNQPNVSSDIKLKYDIHDIEDMFLDSFEGLMEKSFKTIHDDKHSFGYIAQEVEACLYDFCWKVWNTEEEVEAQIDKFKVLNRDGDTMSLLYGEMNVIRNAVLRRKNERQQNQIDDLQRQLDTLISVLKEEGTLNG